MKIAYNDRDNDYVKKVNDAIENNESIPILVNKKDKKYYLEFECEDLGKANAFLYYFMYGNHIEDTGINVTALNYSIINRDEINNILQDAIIRINEL